MTLVTNGGEVMIAEPAPIEIFICYAHEDEEYRQGLEKQLRILRRQGFITIWHDREIIPGTDWQSEIDRHLKSAQIILLLVSPDFMDSDYCYSIEMQNAMERHHRGEAYVIPIIVRPVYWQDAPFQKLQVLPPDAKPIASQIWHNLDDAFYDVAVGIRKVINEIREEQQRSAEEERQRKLREEQLRREEEERQCKLKKEQQRQAEEARQRKIREEQLRVAREERQRKLKEEQQPQAKERTLRSSVNEYPTVPVRNKSRLLSSKDLDKDRIIKERNRASDRAIFGCWLLIIEPVVALVILITHWGWINLLVALFIIILTIVYSNYYNERDKELSLKLSSLKPPSKLMGIQPSSRQRS